MISLIDAQIAYKQSLIATKVTMHLLEDILNSIVSSAGDGAESLIYPIYGTNEKSTKYIFNQLCEAGFTVEYLNKRKSSSEVTLIISGWSNNNSL